MSAGEREALDLAISEAEEGTGYAAYSLDPRVAFEEAVGRLRVIRDHIATVRAALLRTEGERVEGWIMRDQPVPAHANMDPRYWKRVTIIEHDTAPTGVKEG